LPAWPTNSHPFVPRLYEVRGTREAAEANAKAASSLQEARKAGTVSGQYLANTVLFAAAVFLFAVARTVMLPQ
jgi:hypothetical protein